MSRRTGILMISICLFIIVIIISIISLVALQEKEEVCVEARVTYVQENSKNDYKVFIEYDTDQGVKEDIIDHYSSNVKKDDIIEIDCHMEDKYDFVESGLLGTMIVTGILILIGVFGLIKVICEIYQENSKNKLKQIGEVVVAKIREVKVFQKNDKITCIIYCNWLNPNNKKEYQFKTKLDYNAMKYLKRENITELNVYMNPHNLKHYYIDTSYLEQLREIDRKAWEEVFHNYEQGKISLEEYQTKRNQYYYGERE